MHFISLITYLAALYHNGVCLDYDGWLNIKVEHSLNCNGDKFCPRGNISLKSIRAGTAVIDQIHFTKEHIDILKSIADIDGFYTVRTVITATDNNIGTEYLSSMKAQAYLDSGLSDFINAWVLPNGAVIAVSFHATNVSKALVQAGTNKYELESNFFLNQVEQAPVPDTNSYIQKLEREREAREKGDIKDNRSFLAKYWMYIVPVVIFVMISGAANPEPGPQASR